ncbi:caspase family protein [Streptomyces sp. NBC_00433]
MAYRALLIGASAYDDPAIGDLLFVPEDLRRLQSVLVAREFASVEILEAPRGIIRTTVNARVSGFLREARRDDVLFIVLSGHGQRFEGADYLIPEDAGFQIRPFSECCVEIDWQKELEDSAAAQVVFLVDACREGFARDSKSPAGVQGWGRQRIAAALRRKVAYVYACSPAQVALFVRPTDTARDGSGGDVHPVRGWPRRSPRPYGVPSCAEGNHPGARGTARSATHRPVVR